MKIFNFLKKYWLGLVLLILISGAIVISDFYDLKLLVSKRGDIRLSPNVVIPKSQGETNRPKYENKGIFEISPEDLKVDLENLTEEEKGAVLAYLRFKKIKEKITPVGVPEIYGRELNISFDQVQDAINKVAPLDPTYGQKKITLTGADLQRYIKIGSQIACQYCCGAKTLVREDGEAACGCDHSQMMRGLSAYLIKNHPELSDEQILKELNVWKITYFPKQTLSAYLGELEKAGESGIKEILEEFPEFLPQMVGGC